jgi:hypothetical protein
LALSPTEEAQTRQLIAVEAPLLTLAGSEATIISKLGATKVNLSQLPAATVIADADLFLIRQGATDKGVGAAAFKTYASAAAASETVAGIVRLATDTEVATATSRTLAVDPAGLAVSSQKSATITAVATGTADALVAAFVPAITIVANQTILVRATAANATTTPTINPGSGAITLVKGANLPLAIGDISGPGHWLEVTLDTTLGKGVLLNPATGISGSSGRLLNTIYYSVVAQNITLSIASPCVVTYASTDKLPLPNAPIVFSTTGALPTGLVAGTTYYVKSPSSTTSQISATPGGTAINTTGSQSGTQSVANPAYLKAANNPSFVIAKVWGGGGGSGGLGASNAAGTGGGGAGGYAEQKILAASLITSESVTIGSGGAAGSTSGSNGGSGGASSFGAHCSATGGFGSVGVAGATSTSAPGATGGAGAGGDLNLQGAAGCSGSGAGGNPYSTGGSGGASQLGGNGFGQGGAGSLAGTNAATNSASGAGGATGTAAQPGAIGGSGLVIVYEYA